MMNCPMMMNGWGGPWMMIGAGLVWLLIIAVLMLAIAALIKYLRSGRRAADPEDRRWPQKTSFL